MRRSLALIAIAGAALAATAPGAAAKDYARTALNIIPSGQSGSLPPPPGADSQELMYDGLTPLFDHVTSGDLTTYFKSEAFGSLGSDGPGTPESVPHAGVTIIRDKFDVPHVKATTHAGGVWAAGWIAAEDRGLLLQQARYNARVAAIDAPGLSALGLISGLQELRTERPDRGGRRPSDAGVEGRRQGGARRCWPTSTAS